MSEAIYVQHLSPFGCDQFALELKTERIKSAGFVELKSAPDQDEKYWCIWYLPGRWAASGECKGMTVSEIVRWIMRNVGPGQIEAEGKSWGACPD